MIQRVGVFITLAAWLAATAAYSATADETVKRIASLAPAQRRALVEDGARKEAQLVLYTSISLTDYPKIVAAFENRYPFVKVNAYRSTPSGVFTRVETEARAGRYAADVVASAPVEMWELKTRGLSTSYLSPERKAMPAGSYDAEGYWLGFEVTPLVLAFNTRQVASNTAPQNYGDLLDPKWKGKMSLGTEEYTWFNVMLEAMGRQKGTEYMRALARQQLHMPGSSSVMRVQLLLAGESAMAIAARGRRVTEYKERSAPIDFRILEPYAAEPAFTALMQRASHPAAAILFIDWLLSEEGQTKISDDAGRIPVRKGVKLKPWTQALFQKDFAFLSPSSIGPNLNDVIRQYNQIFGLQRR